MVLIGIVALVVANALSTGITGFFVVDNRKEALDQARVAMDRMAKEIRNINSRSDIGTATATQLCFRATNNLSDSDATNDYIIISFRSNALTIVREEPAGCPGVATTPILANSITSFTFTYLQSDGSTDGSPPTNTKRIRINLTSTISGETVTLETEVYPRSL